MTEDNIEKAVFEFMLDIKTFITKTAMKPESIRWGFVFVERQIVVPIDLRRRLLDILHFGHSGLTKMETEAKIFWWPEKKNDLETTIVKDCTVCLASGKNLKYHLPRKHYGKLEKLTEPGQKIQIDFTGNLQ